MYIVPWGFIFRLVFMIFKSAALFCKGGVYELREYIPENTECQLSNFTIFSVGMMALFVATYNDKFLRLSSLRAKLIPSYALV